MYIAVVTSLEKGVAVTSQRKPERRVLPLVAKRVVVHLYFIMQKGPTIVPALPLDAESAESQRQEQDGAPLSLEQCEDLWWLSGVEDVPTLPLRPPRETLKTPRTPRRRTPRTPHGRRSMRLVRCPNCRFHGSVREDAFDQSGCWSCPRCFWHVTPSEPPPLTMAQQLAVGRDATSISTSSSFLPALGLSPRGGAFASLDTASHEDATAAAPSSLRVRQRPTAALLGHLNQRQLLEQMVLATSHESYRKPRMQERPMGAASRVAHVAYAPLELDATYVQTRTRPMVASTTTQANHHGKGGHRRVQPHPVQPPSESAAFQQANPLVPLLWLPRRSTPPPPPPGIKPKPPPGSQGDGDGLSGWGDEGAEPAPVAAAMPAEPWDVNKSIWAKRREWADSRQFYDTESALRKAMEKDYGRGLAAGLAKHIARDYEGEKRAEGPAAPPMAAVGGAGGGGGGGGAGGSGREGRRGGGGAGRRRGESSSAAAVTSGEGDVAMSSAELDEVRAELVAQAPTLYAVFDYYASLGSSGDFSAISFNSYKLFISDMRLALDRTTYCDDSYLDQLFIQINAAGAVAAAAAARAGGGAKQSGGSNSLGRCEMIRVFVRVAICRFILEGSELDVSQAVRRMCEQIKRYLVPQAKQPPNEFRREYCYNEQVSHMLFRHRKSLRAVYEVYADPHNLKRSEDKLLGSNSWMLLIKHLGFFDQAFQQREGTLVFVFSRLRAIDEESERGKRRIQNLSFEDVSTFRRGRSRGHEPEGGGHKPSLVQAHALLASSSLVSSSLALSSSALPPLSNLAQYLEAIVRCARLKSLPTKTEITEAMSEDAGIFLCDLRCNPIAYAAFVESREPEWDGPLRQPIECAVEAIILLIIRTIEGTIKPGAQGDLRLSNKEVLAFYNRGGRDESAMSAPEKATENAPPLSDFGGGGQTNVRRPPPLLLTRQATQAKSWSSKAKASVNNLKRHEAWKAKAHVIGWAGRGGGLGNGGGDGGGDDGGSSGAAGQMRAALPLADASSARSWATAGSKVQATVRVQAEGARRGRAKRLTAGDDDGAEGGGGGGADGLLRRQSTRHIGKIDLRKIPGEQLISILNEAIVRTGESSWEQLRAKGARGFLGRLKHPDSSASPAESPRTIRRGSERASPVPGAGHAAPSSGGAELASRTASQPPSPAPPSPGE